MASSGSSASHQIRAPRLVGGLVRIDCATLTLSLIIADVQLLLHGSTYTSQYWDLQANGFQNYSYVTHACAQGHTTFAYDTVGVGLSDRPLNSTDIGVPTAAAVATSLAVQLKNGTLTTALGAAEHNFSKVFAMGHSQGSVVWNYIAVTQGASAPVDAIILTGHIHDNGSFAVRAAPRPSARDINPARWGDLDPGFISTANRTQYYSLDNSTYSHDLLTLDDLTKDISTMWYTLGLPSVYVPAVGYKGQVVELVGSMDQVHCINVGDNFTPCNATALQVSEQPFWPDSSNFTVVVRPGSGHDVNFDFGAAGTFDVYTQLMNTFAA